MFPIDADGGSTLRRRMVLPLAVIAAMLIALSLPSHGWPLIFRVPLGIFAVLMAPGWFLANALVARVPLLARAGAAVVLSASYLALLGYFSYLAGQRMTGTLIVCVTVPLVIVLGALFPIEAIGSFRPMPLLIALLLITVGCGSAIATHLLLPKVPVESTYSINAPSVIVHDSKAEVMLTVDRVRYPQALTLIVDVNYRFVEEFNLGGRSGAVTLQFAFPKSATCSNATVVIKTNNGQFLTPPLDCIGI